MLRQQLWFDFCDALDTELLQSRDEGKDVSPFEAEAKRIMALEKGADREAAGAALLEQLSRIPAALEEKEPSDLSGIRALAEGEEAAAAAADVNKIYGAWLARCAGCLLGQPIEGWKSERIRGLLTETGNLPLKGYISSDISAALREKYGVSDEGGAYGGTIKSWINNVSHMPEDDDTNYTVIALKLLETYGRDFTPDDVAECWLMNLPLLHVCTAERVAYINLAAMRWPPESATWRNPYREYIGAQIRGDLFGYVNPGDPAAAAEMAWRDASISHIKNGIYGEMWVAACLAKAAVCDDIPEVIRAGMRQIPKESRLHDELSVILSLYTEGKSADEALGYITGKYNEDVNYDWCHTIANAAIVAVALLWGEKDLGKTLELSIIPGFDTDCNGATAGSILGMLLGAEALPKEWIAPLNDRLLSGVDGFGLVRLSEMAERTAALVK